MRLWRAHGLGNVYLVVEDGPPITPALARLVCDPTVGVGSDGILEPFEPDDAQFGVRIWNPDGSVAEKSGNGLRIFARWLSDHGAAREFTVSTGFDVVRCEVGDVLVRVEMGRAKVLWADQELGPPAPVHITTAIDVGNPHCVLFVDTFAHPWEEWGEVLETHPRFPNRTNVQFAHVCRDDIEIRIWERGAGVTPASGSSACAVAAAAVFTGRERAGTLRIRSPGGVLFVDVSASLDLVLTGPVQGVGRIQLDPDWLRAAEPARSS